MHVHVFLDIFILSEGKMDVTRLRPALLEEKRVFIHPLSVRVLFFVYAYPRAWGEERKKNGFRVYLVLLCYPREGPSYTLHASSAPVGRTKEKRVCKKEKGNFRGCYAGGIMGRLFVVASFSSPSFSFFSSSCLPNFLLFIIIVSTIMQNHYHSVKKFE